MKSTSKFDITPTSMLPEEKDIKQDNLVEFKTKKTTSRRREKVSESEYGIAAANAPNEKSSNDGSPLSNVSMTFLLSASTAKIIQRKSD